MKRFLAGLCLVVLVAGCVSMSRAMSYGNRWADARYEAAGKSFSAWVHPTENVVMIQGDTGSAVGAGALQGATFGAMGTHGPRFEVWRAGAEALVSPVGCTVRDLRPIDQAIMWEFDYDCPADVDLRALIMAQRESRRSGAALHR